MAPTASLAFHNCSACSRPALKVRARAPFAASSGRLDRIDRREGLHDPKSLWARGTAPR